MDIFEKSVEIWKQIDESTCNIFQPTIIVDNEYIGKGDNLLSSTAKSVIILDGKLNQLHFVRTKSTNLVHQVVLLTPQPIHKYSKLELSTTKQFVALIGKDTVGIVDISKISGSQTCKKVTEVFSTHDTIISVQWYPQMYDCIAILTTQSISIFQCRSDMKVIPCFQYRLNDSVNYNSKSLGIKEKFVTFDFGSSDIGTDDNTLFMLTDSGDVWLLPELRLLVDNNAVRPKKLSFSPPAFDNYEDEFTSLVVLRGSLDILVLVNGQGTVHHALVISEKVCVYETINVIAVSKDHKLGPIIVADRHSYPPRYLLLHSSGIHSCVLPWAVHLRLSVQSGSHMDLLTAFNDAGSAIIDHTVDTGLTVRHSQTMSAICGIAVIREAVQCPELIVFVANKEKRIVRARLRQESSLMVIEERDDNEGPTTVAGHSWPATRDSTDMFMKAIRTELGRGGPVPCVAVNISDNCDEGEAKLALVLKINERITSDFGSRLENAGQLLDQRMDQMKNIVKLQQDQVAAIVLSSERLQRKGKEQLGERFKNIGDRQWNLLNRLSHCSDRLAVINKVVPRIDRDAANTIRGVEKKLASMQALLRSCKVRFDQNGEIIERMSKKEDGSGKEDLSDIDRERMESFLLKEDSDINGLVEEIRALMQ